MTTTGLVSEGLQSAPAPSQPKSVTRVALGGLLLSLVGLTLMVLATIISTQFSFGRFFAAASEGGQREMAIGIASLVGAAALDADRL